MSGALLIVLPRYTAQMRKEYEVLNQYEEIIETEDYTISMLHKYDFDFIKCSNRDDATRYELVPLKYADMKERILTITDNLRDGNNIIIYLLNPNELEQVTQIYENGELIWHLN